jgi:glutamine phosphoribosylpyrophosphate amidotransferase
MCGVLGFYSNKCINAVDKTILAKLFYQSKIRGLHSFGFSYLSLNKIKTFKSNSIQQLELQIASLENTFSLIGHNRYSTSGDYLIMNNNQPIHLDELSLVFNGNISMRTKKENEELFNEKLITDNDGELALNRIKKGLDLKQFLSNKHISFAGLFIKEGKTFAYRNDRRPLHYSIINNSVFIASTSDIFKRATGTSSKELNPNQLIELKELL